MRLIDYIANQEEIGKLWFTKKEALHQIGCTKTALAQSIHDLIKKKRLARIRGEFILIVPLNYKSWGITPADWFIDPLMKSLDLPYYISTLSAAEHYGAAHQKPMQFQVVTSEYLRDIKYNRIHIHFLKNQKTLSIPKQRTQVHTGYASISTPEATAVDLCKYYSACGYWSNIATVLSELLESIDADKLYELIAEGLYELPVIQRLGFILSIPAIGGKEISEKIFQFIKLRNIRWVLLSPRENLHGKITRDEKWKILVNEVIEVDL